MVAVVDLPDVLAASIVADAVVMSDAVTDAVTSMASSFGTAVAMVRPAYCESSTQGHRCRRHI